MARLRPSEALPAPPSVPPELLDPRHPVWTDNQSVGRWRRLHGLPQTVPLNIVFKPAEGDPPGLNFGRGGRMRHHQAANDWARVHNITTPDHPTWIDYRRLRDLLQGAL